MSWRQTQISWAPAAAASARAPTASATAPAAAPFPASGKLPSPPAPTESGANLFEDGIEGSTTKRSRKGGAKATIPPPVASAPMPANAKEEEEHLAKALAR